MIASTGSFGWFAVFGLVALILAFGRGESGCIGRFLRILAGGLFALLALGALGGVGPFEDSDARSGEAMPRLDPPVSIACDMADIGGITGIIYDIPFSVPRAHVYMSCKSASASGEVQGSLSGNLAGSLQIGTTETRLLGEATFTGTLTFDARSVADEMMNVTVRLSDNGPRTVVARWSIDSGFGAGLGATTSNSIEGGAQFGAHISMEPPSFG